MEFDPEPGELGRLTTRPHGATNPENPVPGVQSLGIGEERDGLIHLPKSYSPDRPAPLLILMHGAGSQSERMLRRVSDHVDAAGIIILAPDSRGRNWDIIAGGGYGPDVTFIDRALAAMFDRFAVDPARVAIGGFSDGASYALSLGVMNGDLFTHILAFSPGFMAPLDQAGRPKVFISHGTEDDILPIGMCSRRLAPMLQHGGYDLRYVEFPGGHSMPAPVVQDAFAWFLG